ncbi:hypothetical protein NMR92_003185 [Vibrio cholerae]|nr:hypothetical protein [Vibrio cholerae]EIY4767049.1 hypothetical protein [Vibrio cholerae]EJL6492225.1 hypothetical protein [Vibrio cholerae]EJL6644538.1 hypothetical protein [Vibrio cholerae]
MADPSVAQVELSSIMIKNSDKLLACRELPINENKENGLVSTECYVGSDRPVYYLNESELGKLSLTNEQQKLINRIDPEVSMDELKSNFYSSASEKMMEHSNAIDSQLNSNDEKKRT